MPDQLRALMLADVIDSAMLRHAVHQRGCYPEDTPIASYDPQFITGSLVAAWDKWRDFIRDNSDVPF